MRDTIEPASRESSRLARRSRLLAGPLSLVLVLTLLLAACSGPKSQANAATTTSTPQATVTATNGATGATATATAGSSTTGATGSATATPSATQPLVPSTTPAATGSGTAPSGGQSGTPAATPSAADTNAIKTVIQKANQEQQQAFAQQDPTIMKDTATPSYYNELVQGLNDMAGGGVAQIKLVNLQWGDIGLQGAGSAQATTSETWDTTFVDGSTLEETDTNIYSLVKQNGSWLIQEDQHPDSRLQQPAGPTGSAGSGTGSGSGSGSGSGTGGPTPVPAVQPGSTDQSRNWAGYAATGGTYTAVSGTWTVPNVAADTSPAADATWVGIGGVNSTDLIQAGTDATVESGQVVYAAWIETLPQAVQNVPLDVAAGDKVSVSITQQSTGTWQIVIKNLTTNHNYQTTVSYDSSLSSAEWIEESPVAGRRLLLPLDSFGSVTFSSATTVVGGKQETLKQAGAQPITLSSSSGQALAKASGINATGDGFTVTRTDVPANQISPGLNRRRP